MQSAYQIERQVDEAEHLAFRCLYPICGIWFGPDADGDVDVGIVHERLEGTEMGIRAALHLYRIELGVVDKYKVNLCAIVWSCPERTVLPHSVFHRQQLLCRDLLGDVASPTVHHLCGTYDFPSDARLVIMGNRKTLAIYGANYLYNFPYSSSDTDSSQSLGSEPGFIIILVFRG